MELYMQTGILETVLVLIFYEPNFLLNFTKELGFSSCQVVILDLHVSVFGVNVARVQIGFCFHISEAKWAFFVCLASLEALLTEVPQSSLTFWCAEWLPWCFIQSWIFLCVFCAAFRCRNYKF